MHLPQVLTAASARLRETALAGALMQGLFRNPLADPALVIPRAPELIIGSWCGKHFQPSHVTGRPGWEAIPAVKDGHVVEIKSAILLAPGPAAIREGLPAIGRHLDRLG